MASERKKVKRIKIEPIELKNIQKVNDIDFTKSKKEDNEEYVTIERVKPKIKVSKISKTRFGIKKEKTRKKKVKPSKYTRKITELELATDYDTTLSVNIKPKKILKKKFKTTSHTDRIVGGTCLGCKREFKRIDMHICKAEGRKVGPIYIRTLADKMFWQIQKGKKAINELMKTINYMSSTKLKEWNVNTNTIELSAEKIEEWALDMQEEGLVEVEYPTNLLLSPRIESKKKVKVKEFVFSSGKKIKSYNLVTDAVPSTVKILDVGKNVPIYEVIVPLVDYGTEAIIDRLRVKISEEVSVTSEELLDPRMMMLLKQKFLEKAVEKVNEKFPNTRDDIKKVLAGLIVHKMYGLKDLELLMNDQNLEEISINGSDQPIAVYDKKIGWCITNLKPSNEEEILNFSSSIGRKVGKTISIMNPLLDAHLITGDRVQSTLFPISSSGNTITIRKFSRDPWTITQYIDNGTVNSEVAALLWLAIQYELSIMVSGGTASGKTSALNALTALIPANHRIISIEDVREISLPKSLHWNWVPMTVRESRSEGAGNISMLDLMVTSLRMRPDRIIVGEVRRKKQAEVLFEAIHTGHSVYTTLHADSAEQAYIRMVEDPISIPKSELEGLHLIVIMFRDRRKGFRKLSQVAEIMPIPGDIGERDIKLNLLYRWSPKEDKWEKFQDSERVFNEISMHTGMSEDEAKKDLKDKELVLDWMVKKKVFNIDDFGKIIDEYYINPERVIKLAKKNGSPGALL